MVSSLRWAFLNKSNGRINRKIVKNKRLRLCKTVKLHSKQRTHRHCPPTDIDKLTHDNLMGPANMRARERNQPNIFGYNKMSVIRFGYVSRHLIVQVMCVTSSMWVREESGESEENEWVSRMKEWVSRLIEWVSKWMNECASIFVCVKM